MDISKLRLPEAAAAKFSLIAMEADDLRAEALSVAKLLKDTQLSLRDNPDHVGMLRREAALKERLEAAQEADREARALVSNLEAALNRQSARGKTFVEYSGPMRRRPKGKLSEQLEDLRSQIATLRRKIAKAEAAPVSIASKRALTERWLIKMANDHAPFVQFTEYGEISLRLGRGAQGVSMHDARDKIIALFLHLHGIEPILNLLAPAEAEPANANSLSPQERDQVLRDLRTELLSLERIEESWLDGNAIARRPDADAMAILNLETITPAQKAALEAAAQEAIAMAERPRGRAS